MSAAHTPGPWHVLTNDDDRAQDGSYLITCGRTPMESPHLWGVATIWHQSGGERRGLEDEPNARLIAAAPDLLAALIEAEDLLYAVRKELTLDVLMKMKGAIERAQAAIAKAVS